jgi:hypothetical protein
LPLPFISTDWILEGDMTPCSASGTSEEEGGANMDSAPDVPISSVEGRADPVPFALIGLVVSICGEGMSTKQ